MKKATYFFTFVLMFILVNCNSSYINFAREKSSLLNTPTKVKINGQRYILTGGVNYDWLRDIGHGTKGLGGKVVIRSLSGKPVPKVLDVVKVWVIRRDSNEIWELQMVEENRVFGMCSDTLRLQKRLLNGPYWPINSKYSIVVELVDMSTNKIYFLREGGYKRIDITY